MSNENSNSKDYLEITFPSGRTAYRVLFDQLEIPITLFDENRNEIVIRGKRREVKELAEESMGIRLSKLSIKGTDGTTLDDNGIFERGQRAETKAVEESSEYKAGDYGITNMISKVAEELKERERQSKIDKLEELCRPISDYLRENYCPYDSIVITDDKIRLVRDEIGIPVDREEEDELDNLYNKLVKEIDDDINEQLQELFNNKEIEVKVSYDKSTKALEEYLESLRKGIELIKKLNPKTK